MTQTARPSLPLPPPLMVGEEGSFAYYTVTKRLPDIVRRVIAENDFPPAVVEALRTLEGELPHGHIRPLEDDGGPDVEDWAVYVAPYQGRRWLDVPWYFAEAYFYRRILEATRYFAPGPSQGVDPYAAQKRMGLTGVISTVRHLSAQRNRLAAANKGWNRSEFIALLYYALWGNRVDLSLWPVNGEGDVRHQDATSLQQANLLVDDTAALADKVVGLQGARIDFIADNAAFELFCDLCLVDFLLTTGVAASVHLHLKPHPTFVSDAMIQDVHDLLKTLAADDDPEVRTLAARLQEAIRVGRLALHTHGFWTAPLAFWEMPESLRRELGQAALVFVKGDANYRRLLGDLHWAFTTPFAEIVSYFPAPLVALRTLKSELAAGLAPGQPEEMARRDPHWLTDGRWGVIQFVDLLD